MLNRANKELLKNELEIIWLENPDQFRYVREGVYQMSTRGRSPGKRIFGGKVVAYAKLKPDTKSDYPGEFLRRFWFLQDNDPYPPAPNYYPAEAADPKSIKAGEASSYPVD
jgi:hypothetical protein